MVTLLFCEHEQQDDIRRCTSGNMIDKCHDYMFGKKRYPLLDLNLSTMRVIHLPIKI